MNHAPDFATWVFLLACGGLCYTGFCRLVHVSPSTTDPAISLAIWAFTVAATFGVFSVMFMGYSTGWPSSLMAVGMLGLHVATSRAWREGLPEGYRAPALDDALSEGPMQ